jgi:predicted Rossmann fold flavoprotein
MKTFDVIIIGAGATGLMCAITAGQRNRKVLVLDHANKPGKKILMSGGGRCNFTNLDVKPENFISNNPHFCKSALSRYTPFDFIELVKKHRIPFHEKTLGQLFCDDKSKAIVEMLLQECAQANVTIQLNSTITKIKKLPNELFQIQTTQQQFICESLVIATGGLSIPTMGASPFGYKVAEQFGIAVWPTRAGLVPLTLHTEDKAKFSTLSGIAIDSLVSNQRKQFRENSLFTHRGMSGPAILQISSYWEAGETIHIHLLPNLQLESHLKHMQQQQPQKLLKNILAELFPKRMVETFITTTLAERPLQTISHNEFTHIAKQFQDWIIKPNGTEGYRTAEVTLGGVDCNAISSKTFQANNVPGLYFIGEVLDVTGWLGGYNFQWAWSSGWCAGQVV